MFSHCSMLKEVWAGCRLLKSLTFVKESIINSMHLLRGESFAINIQLNVSQEFRSPTIIEHLTLKCYY